MRTFLNLAAPRKPHLKPRRNFTLFVTPVAAGLALAVMLAAAASTAPRFDDAGYSLRPVATPSKAK